MVGGQKWISDNALRLTTIDNYEFMYYFLQSMNLNDLATKTAQPLITGSLVKNQYSALPPINEQQSIVDYIKLKNNQLSDTISTLKNEIQLMSEYKTSLINEAVTGKIDVRDYQITHA
jgi:type I restriction enzyme S subunit